MTTMIRSHVPPGAGASFAPAVVGLYDDFVTTSISGTADAAQWRLTGTAATATLKDSARASDLKAGPGVLTLATVDTAQASLQLNGESFRLMQGKRLWAGIRLALLDIDATQLWFGLSLSDTTLLAGQPSDFVGFLNVAADNRIKVSSAKASSATLTDTGKIWDVDGAIRLLTFEWNGHTRLTYFVDGVQVHQSIVSNTENNNNLPNAQDLTLGVEILGAATESVEIDYIYCFMER